MTATLKYALSSDKKMQLVAKMIQGKSVDEALKMLKFMPKKAAAILYKVVHSAYSNAVHNEGVKGVDLYVAQVQVGRGPKLKRYRFASRSRVHGYVKHRSFVRVVLQVK